MGMNCGLNRGWCWVKTGRVLYFFWGVIPTNLWGGHLLKGDLELSSEGKLEMLLKHRTRNIRNVSSSTGVFGV